MMRFWKEHGGETLALSCSDDSTQTLLNIIGRQAFFIMFFTIISYNFTNLGICDIITLGLYSLLLQFASTGNIPKFLLYTCI